MRPRRAWRAALAAVALACALGGCRSAPTRFSVDFPRISAGDGAGAQDPALAGLREIVLQRIIGVPGVDVELAYDLSLRPAGPASAQAATREASVAAARAAGREALILGRYSADERGVRLVLEGIDVPTGRVVAHAALDGADAGAVAAALPGATAALLESWGFELDAAQRARVTTPATRSAAALARWATGLGGFRAALEAGHVDGEGAWSDALAEASALDPSFPDALVTRGWVARAVGSPEAAHARFEQAAALGPGLAMGRLGEALTWADLGAGTRARALAEAVASWNPAQVAWADAVVEALLAEAEAAAEAAWAPPPGAVSPPDDGEEGARDGGDGHTTEAPSGRGKVSVIPVITPIEPPPPPAAPPEVVDRASLVRALALLDEAEGRTRAARVDLRVREELLRARWRLALGDRAGAAAALHRGRRLAEARPEVVPDERREAAAIEGLLAPPLPDGAAVPVGFDDAAVELRDLDALARRVAAAPHLLSDRDCAGLTLLHVAADRGEDGALAWLVEHGAEVDARDLLGETPLHRAAWQGQEAAARRLVAGGALVDARDATGRTPLTRAVLGDREALVASLLAAGASPVARDAERATPLHLAAQLGRLALVERLAAAEPVAVATRDRDGRTPLHVAAVHAEPALVRRLIALGAPLEARTSTGLTPLLAGAAAGRDDVVLALIAAGADLSARDGRGRGAAHLAAERGGASLVELLLARGLAADDEDRQHATPLLLAVAAANAPAADALLRAGADVDHAADDGRTALAVAAAVGDAGLVQRLLEADAHPLVYDARGETPLEIAISEGHVALVPTLFAASRAARAGGEVLRAGHPGSGEEGADEPIEGRALRVAIVHGRADALTSLLDAGAPIEAESRGRTPLGAAAAASRADLVALLLARGADAERRAGPEGLTPLGNAARADAVAGLQALLDGGAALDTRDGAGATALHRAAEGGALRAIASLLARGAPVDTESALGTPLEVAMVAGKRDAGELLRARGAALDAYTAAWLGELAEVKRRLPRAWLKRATPGRGGYTVLQEAVRGGADAVVAWLIAAGVQVDEPAGPVAGGTTALWLAAGLGYVEIVEQLLAAGADPSVGIGPGDSVEELWLSLDEGVRDQLGPRFRQLGIGLPPMPAHDESADGVLDEIETGAGGPEQLAEIALASDVIRVEAAGVYAPDPLTAGYERVALRCARRHAYLETARAADDQVREREALSPGPSVVTSVARHNLGRARFHLLEDDAGPLLERALSELRALAGPADEALGALAIAIDNVGQLRQRAGRAPEAEALFREALALRLERRVGTSLDLARSYGQLGALHTELGRYAEAERELARALELREAGPAEEQELATAVNNLAVLRDLIGDHGGARALYATLLERLAGGDPSVPLAIAHYNVAASEAREGQLEAALGHIDDALATLHEAAPGGSYIDGRLLLGRASVLAALDRGAEALEAARAGLAALDAVHGGAGGFVARAHRIVGELALARGALDEARGELGAAMALAAEAGALEELWPAQLGFARLLARRKATGPAILLAKEAVRTIEGLRAGVRGVDGSGGLDLAFAQDRHAAYRFLADTLFDAGRLPEAMDVLSLLKAAELDAYAMRGRATAAGAADPASLVPTTPAEAPLAERFAAVRDELTARGAELAALREKKQRAGADGLSAGEQARLAELRGIVELGRRAFDAYLASLEGEIAALPGQQAMALGALDLKRVRAMQGTLRALGDGVVLLHYLVVGERLRILVTTPEVQLVREVPIAAASLGRLVGRFRELLEEPSSDVRPLARRFYCLLIAPIAKDLEAAHAKTLMLSLDGPLRYLPFDALWDGERFLVERVRTVIFTQAAKDKLKDPRTPRWTVAALGLSQAVGRFSALPAVKAELEGIVRRQQERDPDGVVDGIVRLDRAFTADALRDALEAGFPVIHIASHFEFRPGTERDSFLLLGTGDELSLEQIRYDGYPLGDVELLTLSACNTAVGAGGDGAEVEGFAALAGELGVRGVLATLWAVADASTGALMTAMYRQHEADPTLTKAGALRRAKLELLYGRAPEGDELEPIGFPAPSAGEVPATGAGACAPDGPTAASPLLASKLAHPYYWAPFVLMGNWR